MSAPHGSAWVGGRIPCSGLAGTTHALPRAILEWVKHLTGLKWLLEGLVEGSTTGQGLHYGMWGEQLEFLVALSDPSDIPPSPIPPLPISFLIYC